MSDKRNEAAPDEHQIAWLNTRLRNAEHALAVCREHAIEQGRRIEALQDERDVLRERMLVALEERDLFGGMYQETKAERDVLRRVAIAAAADPFPTPETRTAIYEWWAATNATQGRNADSDRSTGREA